MRVYDIFLKLFGLKGFIAGQVNQTNDDDVVDHSNVKTVEIRIKTDGGIHENVTKVQPPLYRRKIVRTALNSIYMAIVLTILLAPCIYFIVQAGIKKNSKYFTSNIFHFMYLMQYVNGVIFYKGSFFDKSMTHFTEQYRKIFVGYIVGFLVSMILAITGVIFVWFDLLVLDFNNINMVGKIVLSIYVFVLKIYAYNIYFANCVGFSVILLMHKKSVEMYYNKLEELVNGSMNNIVISDIIQEFADLKTRYTKSVNALNNIFSVMTTIGLIACYFTVDQHGSPFDTAFKYIDMGFFVVILGVYTYSINRIKNSTGNIKQLIGQTKFVVKFLNRSDLSNFHGDIYTNYADNNGNDMTKKLDVVKTITFRNNIVSNENNIYTEWIILNTTLSEDWEYFKIFGFNFDDVALIQRVVVFGVAVFGLLQLNTKF